MSIEPYLTMVHFCRMQTLDLSVISLSLKPLCRSQVQTKIWCLNNIWKKLCKWTSFSFIFGPFKQTLQSLQQYNVKKCPSSIQCWDSIPQPIERESPSITTTPVVPPLEEACLYQNCWLTVITSLRSKMAMPVRRH